MIGLYWFILVYMIGLCYRFETNWTNFDLNEFFLPFEWVRNQ